MFKFKKQKIDVDEVIKKLDAKEADNRVTLKNILKLKTVRSLLGTILTIILLSFTVVSVAVLTVTLPFIVLLDIVIWLSFMLMLFIIALVMLDPVEPCAKVISFIRYSQSTVVPS